MTIYEQMAENTIRAETILHLDGMTTVDVMAPALRDAIDDDFDFLEKLLGIELVEDHCLNWLAITEAEKTGFLVKMATPHPKFHDSINSFSFSWGWYTTMWFHAPTLEKVYQAAIEWQELFHNKSFARYQLKQSQKAAGEDLGGASS